MKIAIVVPGGVDRSGEFRVIPVFLTFIAQLARKHEVHVYVLRQEAEAGSWPLAGATVHNIGKGRTRIRAIQEMHREHRRAPFDVVQSLFSGTCGLMAVIAARWMCRPCFIHIGGGELVALADIGYGGRLHARGRWREAIVLRSATAVTAASAPIIDALDAIGIHAQRIAMGVDLHVWPPLPPRPRIASTARLIHVASLNPVKDQPTLLRALAIVVAQGIDAMLDIVGVDTLDGAIQRLTAELGLSERVRFLGFKTQRELRPLIEAADLLVMSSRHEAGPIVLLEAAIAGVPTVGTAVGHIAEWSPDAALASAPGDSQALAEHIQRALTDEHTRIGLAEAGQRRAMQEDAAYTVAAFERLYATARKV